MFVHVLLYNVGKDDEGIHSIDLKGKTLVLMFVNKEDAQRYCGLLEAQDFPSPIIELINKEEIEAFCDKAGYEARLVEDGFIPKTEEERLLLSPPQVNLQDNITLNEDKSKSPDNSIEQKSSLDDIRSKLEKLI